MAEQAGADLARINQNPVAGYGFVRRRDRRWPPPAEFADHEGFLVSYLPRTWPGPLTHLFDAAQLAWLEALLDQERTRPRPPAVLAHGDFDATQIYCRDGNYTGLIDFGEIRGAEASFDLGHCLLLSPHLLPALLTGYRTVRPVDQPAALRRSAVLLGLRQLCRWLGPPRDRPVHHPAVTQRAHRLTELLTDQP